MKTSIHAEFIGGARDGVILELPEAVPIWEFFQRPPGSVFTWNPDAPGHSTDMHTVYELVRDANGLPSISDAGRHRYQILRETRQEPIVVIDDLSQPAPTIYVYREDGTIGSIRCRPCDVTLVDDFDDSPEQRQIVKDHRREVHGREY